MLDKDLAIVFHLSTLVSPYNSWIMAEYFNGMPRVVEAALIDGASRLTILTRILLPLSLLAITALMTYSWNNYLYPLILLNFASNHGFLPID